MKRLLVLVVLGIAGLATTPASASAQFVPRFGPPIGFPAAGAFATYRAPGFQYSQYAALSPYSYSFGYRSTVTTLFGATTTVAYSQRYVGPVSPYWLYARAALPAYAYGQSGAYITGASTPRPDFVVAQQRNVARAQRIAGAEVARTSIAGEWNYERGNNAAAPAAGAQLPDPVRAAIDPADPAQVSSGESLNALLKEAARMEAKGAKGPSAYVPPLLLEDIRFGGTPAGDLVNLARQAGTLDFPAAFDDPALAPLRPALEKDFAAVAVPVQAGRAPDPDKVARLEETVHKAQEAAAPVVRNMTFEDATAARRFLNSMANAVRALKAGGVAGLIDPKWATEGLTVGDLARHMTRHKLQFGAAPRGGEESYATLHQNLATYVFVLNQPKK